MSLLTRKHASTEPAGTGGRALHAARHAVPIARQRAAPIARQAVPMAKNAGLAARHGAEGAVAWATPHVDHARSWAAPRIEQTGLAVRDSLAPRISALLVTTAHRLDAAPRPARRWPRLLAGIVMLAAAASAAMAMALRQRPDDASYQPSDQPASEGATATTAMPPYQRDGSADSQADSEFDGQFRV